MMIDNVSNAEEAMNHQEQVSTLTPENVQDVNAASQQQQQEQQQVQNVEEQQQQEQNVEESQPKVIGTVVYCASCYYDSTFKPGDRIKCNRCGFIIFYKRFRNYFDYLRELNPPWCKPCNGSAEGVNDETNKEADDEISKGEVDKHNNDAAAGGNNDDGKDNGNDGADAIDVNISGGPAGDNDGDVGKCDDDCANTNDGCKDGISNGADVEDH